MQQPSCNYIPPGVSRLQQSGVFFFCQLRLIVSKHARSGGREGWTFEDVEVRDETKASVEKNKTKRNKKIKRVRCDQMVSSRGDRVCLCLCSFMGRGRRRALPRVNRGVDRASAEV